MDQGTVNQYHFRKRKVGGLTIEQELASGVSFIAVIRKRLLIRRIELQQQQFLKEQLKNRPRRDDIIEFGGPYPNE